MKVAIVDDHKMFRQGVESMLNERDDVSLAWGAKDAAETIVNLANDLPDVILMDISLGEESGITLTKEILEAYPHIKILGLSMHKEDNYIVNLLEAGAKGYLLKDAGSDEMVLAIKKVYEGDTYYSSHVTNVLMKHITKGTKPSETGDQINLTNRETEILKLIAEEYSNPEIAQKLFISIRTVDTHRRNLLDKLQAKNTAGLVRYAMKHGLVV
ncbi:MAG: DNA-binding NarL/FixJ family response regulator [Saprospiraceae bacterium]|jgi:DNA-binding NarL/FixJ family response regulator|tara:strand:- start:997 stop:1635 length:639 start_codon:yes stop_codon:yes gene_type:complete